MAALRALALMTLALHGCAAAGRCALSSKGELPARRQAILEASLLAARDKAAVHFNLALAWAQVGNEERALASLEQALARSPWLDPAAEPLLAPLRRCDRFRRLVARIEERHPAVSASAVTFIVAQADLLPEGLAADPRDGALYLGSSRQRKILKIAPGGQVTQFVSPGQDGLLGVLGLKVDPRDGSVWAASEAEGKAALFHFDAAGKTLEQFAPAEPGEHLFNDLVIAGSGDIFITDSAAGAVYRLAQGRLAPIDLQGRRYPNGIALSADEQTIYLAHAFGIAALRGSEIRDLSSEVSLAAVDGLYFWKGSLIAIQNSFGLPRIVQLTLQGDTVSSGKLLEYRSPLLESPTTGAIYQGSFYYLVNTEPSTAVKIARLPLP